MTNSFNIEQLAWGKMNDLLPAIIQDCETQQVLMLGYMNQTALQQTLQTKQVTFYSRSKQRLWTKGETSGHNLSLIAITADCDNDALLIQVKPNGPTCHLNQNSCFGVADAFPLAFLLQLEKIIQQRIQQPTSASYISKLFAAGMPRLAQKVGEEAVEVSIAAVSANQTALRNEAADLLFHFMLLLQANQLNLNDIMQELKQRHQTMKRE